MPQPRGTQHPQHKLTETAVREIREAYEPGKVTYQDLANVYGVSMQLVAQVAKRQRWSWVE